MKTSAMNLGAGMLVLGTAFFLLPMVLGGLLRVSLDVPGLLLLFAPFYRSGGPANFIWGAILIAMGLYGLIRHKPGYAVAPFAFAALWLLVSVGSRAFVELEAAGTKWQPAVPAAASGYRTLIVDGWWSLQPKLVADGVVDRLIQVSRNHNSKRIEQIWETTLARGDQCSTEELRLASALADVGRPDECYKRQRLDSIPDGLVIAHGDEGYDVDYVHGQTGCCNHGRVKRRQDGQDEPLFEWRQGYARVLSYLPYYYLDPPPRGTMRVWGSASAPIQIVKYGSAEIEPKFLAAAIYGVSVEGAPNGPGPDPERLITKAEILSSHQNVVLVGEPISALGLLNQAKQQGVVNDRSLKVAASLVGEDAPVSRLDPYIGNLNHDQLVVLMNDVFVRLETPGVCRQCFSSATNWTVVGSMPEAAQIGTRARDLFEQRRDLSVWQYQAALRIVLAALAPSPEQAATLQDEVFQALVADDSPAFGEKAAAFAWVFRTRKPYEPAAVAPKLDLVSDMRLETVVMGFWSYQLVGNGSLSPEQRAEIPKVCARLNKRPSRRSTESYGC
jgi:hypothetical protein